MKCVASVLIQLLFLATACAPTPTATNWLPIAIATPTPPVAKPSPPAIAEIAEQARSYTVRIQVQDRFGNRASASGIVIDNKGRILTNSHVVEDTATIEISSAGRSAIVPGRLIGVSTCDDLAVLQITGLNTGVANLGNSDDLRPGDDVIAIGFPLGAEDSSVSRGIVSRLHVSIDPLQDLIQTDASVNPGNSGGPLINRAGQVIGIITAKTLYDRNGNPVAGIAYAISSNHANLVILDLGRGINRNCQSESRFSPTSIPPTSRPQPGTIPSPTQTPYTPTPSISRLDPVYVNDTGQSILGTNLVQGLNLVNTSSGAERKIMYYGNIFSAAWSSDGKELIMTQGWYSSDTWYGSALQLARPDERNLIEIREARQGDRFLNPQNATHVFQDAIWSPNSLKIAFLHHGLLGEDWIECPVVVNRDGSGMRRLEQCEADDHPRYWSVDGKWIVVWSERSPALYAYEVDGNRRLLLSQLGKIPVYDERYYPWRVVDSPVCKSGAGFWNCE